MEKKIKKECVAVVLTMQLKVCNPRPMLSLWSKVVTTRCTAMTDASLLKDPRPLWDSRRYFIEARRKKRKLWLVYMNCGVSARQSVIRKHFSCSVYLLYKRYVTLPPRAELPLPRSCLAKKSPPARLQEVTHFMLQNTSLSDTHAPSLASSLAFCFL